MNETHISEELNDMIAAEVAALHKFLAAWFRGDVEGSELLFQKELAERLAPSFQNIQPSGEVLSLQKFLSLIHDGYGSNEEFKIEIADCFVRYHEPTSGLLLAVYDELQSGAKNTTPSQNLRRSTVLFELGGADERPTWLHIHETGLTY